MIKMAVILTDNGTIYWGQPVDNGSFCINLQKITVKDNEVFPSQEGRLSIPFFRIIEMITLDNSFLSASELYEKIEKTYKNFKPNDKDDPSIADAWKIA